MSHRFVDRRTRRLASGQRRSPTIAERVLWRELRGRNVLGVKFRRQHPLGPYVADFVSLEAHLVVELDGPVHDGIEQRAHDARRDAWLREQGFAVLRFSNELFLSGSGELAMRVIEKTLAERTADPSSDPASPGHLLPQGEKGRSANAAAPC